MSRGVLCLSGDPRPPASRFCPLGLQCRPQYEGHTDVTHLGQGLPGASSHQVTIPGCGWGLRPALWHVATPVAEGVGCVVTEVFMGQGEMGTEAGAP